jgi:hypothetical protein
MSDAHQGLCAQLYQSSPPVLSMHMLQQGLTLTGLPSILYTNPQGCSINVVGSAIIGTRVCSQHSIALDCVLN